MIQSDGILLGNGVRDIEILEMAQIEKYQSSLRQKYKGKKIPPAYEHIIGIARRAVFLGAEEIHWQANIWYLERFHISERRKDSSKSLESVSFLEIVNRENRKYAQEYMKYELGIMGQALSTVTGRYRFVRNFLIGIDKNVCQCTHEDIENYIKKLQENVRELQRENGELKKRNAKLQKVLDRKDLNFIKNL